MRLWTADAIPGATAFEAFTRSPAGWTRDADQTPVDSATILVPFRAFFLAPPAPEVGVKP